MIAALLAWTLWPQADATGVLLLLAARCTRSGWDAGGAGGPEPSRWS